MNELKASFLKQLDELNRFDHLFDFFPELLFFCKNLKGQIIMANQPFAEHCGYSCEEDIIGMTDHEIFPMNLAEKYVEDDRLVTSTATPRSNIIELFPNNLGIPEWYTTNKIPLFSKSGEVVGLAGTTQSYEGSTRALQPYLDIAPVVEYIKQNYAESISIPELARMVNLSTRQFERRFIWPSR